MSAAQVIELALVAIGKIAEMIQRGMSHEEALRHVRSIGSDAKQVDRDVDEAGK
jgi:hypothetical protein